MFRLAMSSLLCVTVMMCSLARAQTPVPATAVAIENSNAAFAPTDVNIPQANPARPTVTIPAHIPPTGYLQFEQGVNYAGRSPGGTPSQAAINQTSKLALTTRLMIHFVSQPYAYSAITVPSSATQHSNDPGDLVLGVHAIVHKAVGPTPTIAVAYFRRMRTGTSGNLDSGDYSQSAFVLLGGDLAHGFHYDSNILFNEQTADPVRRLQTGQTLAVSHVLFPKLTKQLLGGTIELSHFTQPFTSDTAGGKSVARANSLDLLFVAAYALRPDLIIDASFSKGLTSTSTQYQGGFGFTYLLPRRLWKDTRPAVISVGRAHGVIE